MSRSRCRGGKSTATAAVLEQLVADRLLAMNINSERPAWIPQRPEETEPNPPEGYIVSLVRLHKRGFGVPVSRFMRALCEHYGAELHNFGPNSISQRRSSSPSARDTWGSKHTGICGSTCSAASYSSRTYGASRRGLRAPEA